MRIGDVAARAGVSVRALRYYEEQGLLPSERSPSGQRRYDDGAIARVELLQLFFRAGLPSASIRRLLPSVEAGVATRDAVDHLLAQRSALGERVRELQAAAHRLDEVITVATSGGHGCARPADATGSTPAGTTCGPRPAPRRAPGGQHAAVPAAPLR